MSPAMTFLSTMSDTLAALYMSPHDGLGRSWLGVMSHDVSVKVSEIKPKGLLPGIAVVKNIASAPDSSTAADDRDRGSGIA